MAVTPGFPKRTATCFKRMLCISLLIGASSALSLYAAAPTFQVKVETDQANAIYDTGETATFQITVTQAGQPMVSGKVSYLVDDFITDNIPSYDYPRGDIELDGQPMSVTATSSKPGFLRCVVTFQTPKKKLIATGAAAFSPLKIAPGLPVPDDFDEFWADQKHQLAEVPAIAKLTPVSQSDSSIKCFDVRVECLGGAPVSGYLAVPEKAQPAGLPAVLWVHGAGVRSASLGAAMKGAGGDWPQPGRRAGTGRWGA